MIKQISMVYVNAYHAELAYGGNEEGGWWYEVGEPLASVPVKLTTPYEYEVSDALPGDENYGADEPPAPDMNGINDEDCARITAIVENLKRELADFDDPRGISSTISTGVVRVYTTFAFAQPYPDRRPRYE